MLASQKIGNEFYQNLGKLFYAVAMADRSVHIKEVEKLRIFVRQYWLDADTIEDEYGEDAAFQIETVFDWLLEYEKTSEECYTAFKEFYRDNSGKFTTYIKVLVLDTANAIASAFAQKNKAELILISKLQLLFHT